jgi:hypothetical protein
MTAPDWLSRREGTLQTGLSPETLFVVIAGRPDYRIDVRPAQGGYVAAITKTVNGARLDADAVSKSVPDALSAGLSHLKSKLGW